MNKTWIAEITVWANVIALGILVGATVYQMQVIVPEYEREAPRGMAAFAAGPVLPANFWTSFSTRVLEMVPFLALALNWNTPRRKWLLATALLCLCYYAATGLYFVPRLKVMGQTVPRMLTTDMALLEVTVREWLWADQIRFWAGMVPSLLTAMKAMTVTNGRPTRGQAVGQGGGN
ncbi:MAG: hypothetical protein U0R19_12810 [Bryobacteraceae bacterium]